MKPRIYLARVPGGGLEYRGIGQPMAYRSEWIHREWPQTVAIIVIALLLLIRW